MSYWRQVNRLVFFTFTTLEDTLTEEYQFEIALDKYMKEKAPVLLDIDYTLFDNQKFILEKRRALARLLNIEPSRMEEIDMQAADATIQNKGTLVPLSYSMELAKIIGQPELKTKIEAVFDDKDIYLVAIYPETVSALKSLITKFRLGIFSEGDTGLQLTKLDKTGISSYLRRELIFIFHGKIDGLKNVKLCRPSAVIDDKPQIIKLLAPLNIPYLIRVKRGRFSDEPTPKGPNIFEVSDLNEVVTILKKSDQF